MIVLGAFLKAKPIVKMKMYAKALKNRCPSAITT
jgi:hypothetical protein